MLMTTNNGLLPIREAGVPVILRVVDGDKVWPCPGRAGSGCEGTVSPAQPAGRDWRMYDASWTVAHHIPARSASTLQSWMNRREINTSIRVIRYKNTTDRMAGGVTEKGVLQL